MTEAVPTWGRGTACNSSVRTSVGAWPARHRWTTMQAPWVLWYEMEIAYKNWLPYREALPFFLLLWNVVRRLIIFEYSMLKMSFSVLSFAKKRDSWGSDGIFLRGSHGNSVQPVWIGGFWINQMMVIPCHPMSSLESGRRDFHVITLPHWSPGLPGRRLPGVKKSGCRCGCLLGQTWSTF